MRLHWSDIVIGGVSAVVGLNVGGSNPVAGWLCLVVAALIVVVLAQGRALDEARAQLRRDAVWVRRDRQVIDLDARGGSR